jgi:Arylsulfotransferase (ASST)
MNLARSLCLVILICALIAPGVAHAQVSPGFRLYAPLEETTTYLVDTNGTTVHTWASPFNPGISVYMMDDGTLLRSRKVTGGPAIGGVGGGVQRIALDGTVVWDFTYADANHWSHHDIEPMPNGNVLMLAWENKTNAQAIAAGRNPAYFSGTVMRPDHVVEIQPTGPTTGIVVWEWHVWDHLVQDFDVTKANFGVVSAHPELVNVNFPATATGTNDWNHANSVKYDPVHDWIMISCHRQNEIWVIDHSTTTAQAAGHTGGNRGKGGDLLYRWGNPQSYGAGGPADQKLFGQHSARFVPAGYPGAGNFTIFNNNSPGGSTVVELTPPLDAFGNFLITPGFAYGPVVPTWSYQAAGFNSTFISGCERLPNGNTLVCSGEQGFLFEVTPGGQQVWTYNYVGAASNLVFHTHYVDRTLWPGAASLSGAAGGTVSFDLIAGSPHAGQDYFLLASATGTAPGINVGGFNLPLNYDDVLVYSFQNANTPILTNTFGVLNAQGRATASLNLPAGLVIGPAQAHFAYAMMNFGTLTVLGASNAVPVTITP